MKKKLLALGLVATMSMGLAGCTSIERAMKNFESDTKGLHRIVRVYSDNGDLIETYESKNMLVTDGQGGTIQIDFDGKRVTFCNVSLSIEEVK